MCSAISETCFVIHFGQQVQVLANDLDLPGALLAGLAHGIAPAQEVAALAADGEHVDVLVLEVIEELASQPSARWS